jgi:hypothetical protein
VPATAPDPEAPSKPKAAPKAKTAKAPVKKATKPVVEAPIETGDNKAAAPAKPKVARAKKAKAE